MPIITEGKLEFIFLHDAIKFDETSWYRDKMKSQVKAVDILVKNGEKHWWIEIKDCISFEDENRPRLSANEPSEVISTRHWVQTKGWKPIVSVSRKKLFIIDELIQKMNGTMISLGTAYRNRDIELQNFCNPVRTRQSLTIVLLISWDSREFSRMARLLQQKLNSALLPYGLNGFVINEHTTLPDLSCTISRIIS